MDLRLRVRLVWMPRDTKRGTVTALSIAGRARAVKTPVRQAAVRSPSSGEVGIRTAHRVPGTCCAAFVSRRCTSQGTRHDGADPPLPRSDNH